MHRHTDFAPPLICNYAAPLMHENVNYDLIMNQLCITGGGKCGVGDLESWTGIVE